MKTRLWLGSLRLALRPRLCSPPPVAQERPLPESVLGSETARAYAAARFAAGFCGSIARRSNTTAGAAGGGSGAICATIITGFRCTLRQRPPPPSSTVPPDPRIAQINRSASADCAAAQPPRSDANALAMAQTPNKFGMLPAPLAINLASTPKMIGDTLGSGYLFVVESAVGKGKNCRKCTDRRFDGEDWR